MRRYLSSRLRSGLLAFCLAVPGLAWAGEPKLETADVNRDGKPDHWYLRIGDRVTSEVRDLDYNGVADRIVTRAYTNGKYPETSWADLDFDGEFDLMVVRHSEKCYESWRRLRNDAKKFYYFKRDKETRLITQDLVSALGVRSDSPSTKTIPEFEVGPYRDVRLGHHMDARLNAHGQIVRMRKGVNREAGELYSVLIEMQDSPSTAPLPLKIEVWEYDGGTTRCTVLHDRDGDRRYESVEVETYPGGASDGSWGLAQRMVATDRNCDGRYDRFSFGRGLDVDLTATDDDFNGQLDAVVRLSDGSGERTKVVGDAIGDRTLPVVPIPHERINALLGRAPTVREAEERQRSAKEAFERGRRLMGEHMRAMLSK